MRSPHTTTKSSPRLLQLEKARAQQRRPNAAKNKSIKKKKEESEPQKDVMMGGEVRKGE